MSTLRNSDRVAIVLFVAVCLAACTAVVDSVVDSRYSDYNRTSDSARNEAILLNIIRASQYQPLNFVTYQPYQGTATASTMASSPGFVIGPARVDSQKQYTFGTGALNGSAGATGTIGVTMLDTHDFYDAVLSSVDFTDLYSFQQQGYPRELLFRLFTESVSIKFARDPQGHGASIVYNDPLHEKQCMPLPPKIRQRLYPGRSTTLDVGEICFEDLVKFAMWSGLTSEVKAVSVASTGNTKPAAASGTSTANSSAAKTTQLVGRLCFDGALANRAIKKAVENNVPVPDNLKFVEYHPVCGLSIGADAWPSPPKKGSASSPPLETLQVRVIKKTGLPVWDLHTIEKTTIEIGTRSTFSIYNYLGRILREQQTDPANQQTDPAILTHTHENEDSHILDIETGRAVGCFVAVVYDLKVYCVPSNGAANTKRSFSLLSQLLALKTTQNDLQLLPTIRLLPQ